MTPEQFEGLEEMGESYLNIMPSRQQWPQDILNAARADLAAMRQPITAEALIADGWVSRWKAFLLGGRFRMDWSDDDNRWEFEIGRLSETGSFLHGVTIASPTTMYDLRELVRLLGNKA